MAPIELRMPAVSLDRVTLSKWLVPDGSLVVVGQPICFVETDKASTDFPSPAGGILEQIASEGSLLEWRQLLARIHVGEHPSATSPM